MVSRIIVECRACHKVFALRIQRSGGRQPFVFACPQCSTQIRAVLTDSSDGVGGLLESEDFDQLEADPTADVAVAISTEVPVHQSAIGEPLQLAMLTPFIRLTSMVGNDRSYPVTQRVDYAREVRERVFPHLRRALSFTIRDDVDGASAAIDELRAIWPHLPRDTTRALGVSLAASYRPMEERTEFKAGRRELIAMIKAAHSRDAGGLNRLFASFDAGPLPAHSGRVLDTTISVLDDIAALFPAMWVLAMIEGNVPLEEYRVMRDDFDTVKTRYQDMFELGSRSLVFTATIANIAIRGDARIFADGDQRTLNKALNGTTAAIRESWLSDLPAAKNLYDNMQRHMRNHIGHRLVRYDFVTGTVVDEDGTRDSYLLFLNDYLHAVRLSHYLAEAVLLLRPDQRPR